MFSFLKSDENKSLLVALQGQQFWAKEQRAKEQRAKVWKSEFPTLLILNQHWLKTVITELSATYFSDRTVYLFLSLSKWFYILTVLFSRLSLSLYPEK